MIKSSYFDVEVSGELAMFTTPQSKKSCERISYPMPTYSSLCGIMNSIYFCPGIKWVVEKCRVMNQIQYTNLGVVSPHYDYVAVKKHNRFQFSYLFMPRYQLRTYYVLDNAAYGKPGYHMGHEKRIEAAILHGGREVLKFGTSNCSAYAKSCTFGEDKGYYDDLGETEPVYMFYEFLRNKKTFELSDVGFCMQHMENGIIEFDNLPVVYRKWNKNAD